VAPPPSNSGSNKIALGVGIGVPLGVGIPTLVIAYLSYRVMRRGAGVSKPAAIQKGLYDLVTLGQG